MVMDLPSILRMHGVTPEQLAQMQAATARIYARVHTSKDNREITIHLETDDPAAIQWLPQVSQGIVTSVAHSLYQLFGIKGELV
jgi:hypothetical protein